VKYKITAVFAIGDLIEHKSFGAGIVNQLLGPTKVEVLFEDGLKKLVCNIKP